jgi:hypothetical protein
MTEQNRREQKNRTGEVTKECPGNILLDKED